MSLKDITVTLIAALASASFIQSTFRFRPLVCISGESQSGKSDIQTELLTPLFGGLNITLCWRTTIIWRLRGGWKAKISMQTTMQNQPIWTIKRGKTGFHPDIGSLMICRILRHANHFLP